MIDLPSKLADSAFKSIPEEAVLRDRLVHSIRFAYKAVKHLVIDGHQPPEEAPWFVRSEKIIAESAFLLVYASKIKADKELEQAIHQLASVLIPLARSRTMKLNMVLKPFLALDYGHAHICLHYLGYADAQVDKILKVTLSSPSSKGIERPPYRMLEQYWLLHLWSMPEYPPGEVNLWVDNGILTREIDLFNESADGVYALTHALMYSCDLLPELARALPLKLTTWIDAAVIRYIDDQDYDIAGELLMARLQLNPEISKEVAFAINCLFYVDNKVGFLPAPGLELQHIEGKEIQARRTYIYSINYHTVLVMGLLCSQLLRSRKLVTIGDHSVSFPSPLQKRISNWLAKGKSAHWKEYLHNQVSGSSQEIYKWALQVMICRAVKEKEYGILKNMVDYILPSQHTEGQSPIVTQAKELLERLKFVG